MASQEPEYLSLPPISAEEFTFENENSKSEGTDLWMPAFANQSAGTLTEHLKHGHVYSAIDFTLLGESDEALQFGGNQVITPRITLGWEADNGFGIRSRYWNYQQNFAHNRTEFFDLPLLTPGQINSPLYFTYSLDELVNDNAIVDIYPESYKADTLDIEVYQRFLAGDASLLVGLGTRGINKSRQVTIAAYFNSWGDNYGIDETVSEEFRGVGGTANFELAKPLLSSETLTLWMVGGGRSSYIPTEINNRSTNPLNYPELNQSFDDDLWINEGNLGLELTNSYRYLTWRLRTQLETQYWNSAASDNQAFTGTSLSFGIDW